MTVRKESVGVAGANIVIETGRMALQASGSCTVRCGDTVVLVAVVAAEEPRPGMGFFPLTVEYRERWSAVGKIPPTAPRRELRPSDSEILTARIIDRTIRPLFPSGYRNEVQVIANVLSAEPDAEPGALALLGASVALHLSDIPWAGPVAGGRFTRSGRDLRPFAAADARQGADLDLFVCIGENGLLMVEGDAQEVPESDIVDALVTAEKTLQPLMAVQRRLRDDVGKPKREFIPEEIPAELVEAAQAYAGELREALSIPGKAERNGALKTLQSRALDELTAAHPDADPGKIGDAFQKVRKTTARHLILDGRRFDGRAHDVVRPLSMDTGLLPRSHGSALFTRGETQALASVTLGVKRDQLRYDTILQAQFKRFFLHYNFPSFSVGEVRPMRGPGRREIGHGNLAERALAGMLPPEEEFPYTTRIVSDILGSNGSSSMATVCAGCLALLDAGVALRAPVAGVAMGLIGEGDRVAVLTDILGDEDHLGDMDFKVCGTANGVTALQMDIKLEGLGSELLARALDQARVARRTILTAMAETLPAAREEMSPHAPRLLSIRVRPERIRDVIGPGGSTIRSIVDATGASVDLDDDGLVRIASSDLRAARAALARVEAITEEAEVDAIYRGVVRGVKDMLAFVELFPGTEAGVHISEIAHERINKVGDVLRVGDRVNVRVLGVDNRGRLRASRKAALDADPTEVRDRFPG